MKVIPYFIIVIVFNYNAGCTHAKNDDKEIKRRLKAFYIAHNTAWESIYDELVLKKKTDSLQTEYCTEKLKKELNEEYERHGFDHDLLGLDYSADLKLIKDIKIKKDLNRSNTYIVSYVANSEIPGTGKEIKVEAILHVLVIKENGRYKIDNVWENTDGYD